MVKMMKYPYGATPLDPDEMGGLKFKHIQTRGELDQMEQVNIQDGLLWLDKQKNADILTVSFTLELHKRLFANVWAWAGSFRQSEKNIGINPLYLSVELRKLLDDTHAWVEFDTYPALEIALRFHHRLVQIHLFANGNGRHARIMADAILKFVLNSPTVNWTGGNLEKVSDYRKQYIKALKNADRGDYMQLLTMFDLI